MYNNNMVERDEIFSKVLRAGRRTYFFDVRATKAEDYYLTITESKKFTEILSEMMDYIIKEKGDEVISERHQKDFKKEYNKEEDNSKESKDKSNSTDNFTDVDFDDI